MQASKIVDKNKTKQNKTKRKKNYLAYTAAIFLISISKVHLTSNTTNSANNIIKVSLGQSFKTIKAIV